MTKLGLTTFRFILLGLSLCSFFFFTSEWWYACHPAAGHEIRFSWPWPSVLTIASLLSIIWTFILWVPLFDRIDSSEIFRNPQLFTETGVKNFFGLLPYAGVILIAYCLIDWSANYGYAPFGYQSKLPWPTAPIGILIGCFPFFTKKDK